MPAGEPLAVLVYEEKDIDAFSDLPRYKGAEGGGEGGVAAAEGEEGAMAVDGVTLLKFLHKLVRNGSILDKGEKGGREMGGREEQEGGSREERCIYIDWCEKGSFSKAKFVSASPLT